MGTEKLYLNDSYLKSFTANVEHTAPLENGQWAVTLNRTAFYPESGGQPYDTGEIDGIPVLEVKEENDKIVHILASKPLSSAVTGKINWLNRFDHMQQHSGQHILSESFFTLLGGETVGFHLGNLTSTIDLDITSLGISDALAVESIANEIIFSNRPVSIHNVSAADLKKYSIRRNPSKDLTQIRIIDIENFDCCPCCGTHVATTSEIGLTKILSWERKNNAIRVEFICGRRAIADYRQKHNIVQELSAKLSSPPSEIITAYNRLYEKAEASTKQLALLKQDMNRYLAVSLYQEAEIINNVRLVIHTIPYASPPEVADLARQITGKPKVIALLAGISPEHHKAHFVFSRSTDLMVNMNEQLSEILPMLAGKGGGSSQIAQGGGGRLDKVQDALNQAKQNFMQIIKRI